MKDLPSVRDSFPPVINSQSNSNMKTIVLSIIAGFLVLPAAHAAEVKGKSLVLKNKQGLAIQGYDPVAYFTENKAVKGHARFTSEHEGAKYYFAGAESKNRFDAKPSKYAPAYGGYCGYAASIGKVRPANPLIWSIVDGQLILQHTQGADKLWKNDVAGNKAKADKYWPLLITVKAGKKDPVDSLLGKSALDLANIE